MVGNPFSDYETTTVMRYNLTVKIVLLQLHDGYPRYIKHDALVHQIITLSIPYIAGVDICDMEVSIPKGFPEIIHL